MSINFQLNSESSVTTTSDVDTARLICVLKFEHAVKQFEHANNLNMQYFSGYGGYNKIMVLFD